MDMLTEHSIATSVFERNSNFNPGLDTIVRSHVVRLRQKLDRLAEEDEGMASIRISIPKGEYLVRFVRVAPEPPQLVPLTLSPVSAPSHSPAPQLGRWLVWLSCSLGLAALIFLLTLLAGLHRSVDKAAASPPPAHPLWSQLFQPHQTTTFIAADSGLVLLHRMTARDTTLAEYLNRDFSHETHGLSPQRVARCSIWQTAAIPHSWI